MTKSTKSHLRGLSSLLKIFFRVHELVARSSAWQVCAANGGAKVGGFAALLGFSHTTRANISHEIAEQIRARKPARPLKVHGGRGEVCALTEVTISLLQWGIDRFAKQTRSASPRLGQKVARFTATDEVLHVYCAKQILSRYVRAQTRTQI